ncbi:Protein NRT1/ PTR FAMILY 5.1, partial [Mucuna pruriens]
MELEAKLDHTQDGTVDFRGQSALSSNTGKWKACVFLLGYEAFERMAFYGVASNLVNYLTTQLHEDTVSSVRNVNNWSGSVWITPILGAYIADSHLGRFWTFSISSLIYVLVSQLRFITEDLYSIKTNGMILLTLAVSLKSLRPTCTNGICNKASTLQISFFYMALYTIAIGAGGTKPNISTFGADQFDEFNPNEKETKASFFNWWMFTSFLGALVATLGLVYIQENLGWGLGYGIPTVGLLLSLVIFYIGTPIYRHKVRTHKSPARDLIRVPIAAFRNRKLQLPTNPSGLYEHEHQHYISGGKRQIYHTPALRFLDKAAIKEGSNIGSSRTPLTITQVEGFKLVYGMVIIWLVTLIPSTIWAQVNTLFVKQGITLDRKLGPNFQIPAASLGSILTLSMILSVPMYDCYFVPFMRRNTGNPRGITLLQRLGIGFSIQVVAIAIAYVVEVGRMHVIKANHVDGPKDIVPMRNFLNSFLVTIVDKITRSETKSWIGDNLNNCHLDYYYGFLFALSIINLGVFFWVSSRYIYKREIMGQESLCVQVKGKVLVEEL